MKATLCFHDFNGVLTKGYFSSSSSGEVCGTLLNVIQIERKIKYLNMFTVVLLFILYELQ